MTRGKTDKPHFTWQHINIKNMHRYQYAGGWSKLNSKHTLSDHAGRLVSNSFSPCLFLLSVNLTACLTEVCSAPAMDQGNGG